MHASWNAAPMAERHQRIVAVAATTILWASITGCGGDSDSPRAATSSAVAGATKSAASKGPPRPVKNDHPIIRIETNLGAMTLKLDGAKAPGTVRNFLNYAAEGFYDNTLVHFVAPGKMLVAGGYTADRQPKPARTPIRNEAHNGLKNVRGSIAMTRDPSLIDSATSQFFINLEDAPQRDYRGDGADQYGYCVFGQVIDGLEIANKIAESSTTNLGGDLEQTPNPPIVIASIRVVP